MKNKTTLNAVAYAGGILLFLILLVHLTLSRPDGGFFSSIGILIVSLIKLVFFVVGLLIGVALCIAVMLCIYVAAAYLVNNQLGKTIAGSTYAAVTRQLYSALAALAPNKFGTLAYATTAAHATTAYGAAPDTPEFLDSANYSAPELPQQVQAQSVMPAPAVQPNPMTDVLKQVEQRLADIECSVSAYEADRAQFARTDQFAELNATLQSADERNQAALDASLSPVQDSLEHLAKQGEEFEAVSKKLGDIGLRLTKLEEQTTKLADLPQQISGLHGELDSKYAEIPQQITTLRDELQAQLEALKPKPSPAKGRTRKKPVAQQS